MKTALLILHNKLKENKSYEKYVLREISKKHIDIDTILHIDDNNNELPFLMEEFISDYDNVIILSSEQNHAIAAKILSTLSSRDVLYVGDDVFIQGCEKEENSFMIQIDKCNINLIKLTIGEKLPNILCPKNVYFKFCIYDVDNESLDILLSPIASELDISFESVNLLENLTLISVKNDSDKIDDFIKACGNLFGGKLIKNADIIKHCALKLIVNNKQITFAESCTGGHLSKDFCAYDGVSDVFLGSFVAYSAKTKKAWLNVDNANLKDALIYSQNCTTQMAQGALKATKSNYAIATSGVFGKNDDMGVKSGSVFISVVSDDGRSLHERLELKGDRIYMQECASLAAFMLLIKLDEEMFLD